MKHDIITINDTDYRIEFNWNALADFLETENIQLKEIDKLENLSPKQVTSLCYCGVKEGARMENKPFDFNIEDFGANLTPTDIAGLIIIYRRQTEVETKVTDVKKKKLFRTKT